LWIYFFVATASHGLLDAMTDGGMGVAFFFAFGHYTLFSSVATDSGFADFGDAFSWRTLAVRVAKRADMDLDSCRTARSVGAWRSEHVFDGTRKTMIARETLLLCIRFLDWTGCAPRLKL
jgi:hypothetical protein